MTELIKKFCIQESQGNCTEPIFEFGNLHRKEYICPFCINNGECHYCGKCDHREGEVANEGWRIS